MNRFSDSSYFALFSSSGPVRFVVIGLVFVIGLLAAPLAGSKDNSSEKALLGGASVVAGSAYTHFGSGFWQHNYAVVENKHGVKGFIKEHYYEEDFVDTRYIIEVDCLDIESATREAWIGGEVVEATADFPPIGTRVVYYVDDNDGSNPLNPDIHGGIYTGVEWGEPDYSCYDRPAPWYPDQSQRGKITVN